MAYVSQELKAKLAPQLLKICKKFNVKASVAVNNHSTLVLNISQGPIDFIGNVNKITAARSGGFRGNSPAKDHIQVNEHWFTEHFDGAALKFLSAAIAVMNDGNHDRSDSQSDYFDVGWYVNVNVGKWNKPYRLVAA